MRRTARLFALFCGLSLLVGCGTAAAPAPQRVAQNESAPHDALDLNDPAQLSPTTRPTGGEGGFAPSDVAPPSVMAPRPAEPASAAAGYFADDARGDVREADLLQESVDGAALRMRRDGTADGHSVSNTSGPAGPTSIRLQDESGGLPLAEMPTPTEAAAEPLPASDEEESSHPHAPGAPAPEGAPVGAPRGADAPARPAGQAESPRQADGRRERVEEMKKQLEAQKKIAEKPRSETWKRSRLLPNASRLMVGDQEELPLHAFQSTVRIDGFRARVVLDLQFRNDRDQQLEGTFNLRLPNEATPYFFAFGPNKAVAAEADSLQFLPVESLRNGGVDPAGLMQARAETWVEPKEARMVPREKAAFAYIDTVRRRVDPALMEWAGAGVFSARVFPLAPQTLHRIVIGYDVDLATVGDGLEFRVDLPLKDDESRVPHVVDVSVAEIPGAVISVEPKVDPLALNGRSYFNFKDPADSKIVVKLASVPTVALAGTDPAAGEFFAAKIAPNLPKEDAAAGPGGAVFLLDVSLSENPDKFNVWLKLFEKILAENRSSTTKFAVAFFNVETFWWKEGFVENTPENVAEALAFAHRLALEGATDLGQALQTAGSPTWLTGDAPAYDVFLLSDGSATWGENDRSALSALYKRGRAGAVFAYQTGLTGTDSSMLGHLARETGGAVFSVVGEDDIARAAVAHRARPWIIRGVSSAGASDLLLAGRPQTLFPGQTLFVVGRDQPAGNGEQPANVTLSLERSGEKKEIAVPLAAVLPCEYAPRMYGQVAVGQLEDFQSATEELAKSYATHFRIVGGTCSLLMLESEEDYQRYNIVPADDAAKVKESPAGVAVVQAIDQTFSQLGDPKANFIASLERLKTMPGVELVVSPEMQAAMEALPREAFAVAGAPLVCKGRFWESVDPALQEKLAAHDVVYDMILADARRRKESLGPDDALKALSSLVEHSPGDLVLARDVSFSAMEWNLPGQAYYLLRRAAYARPFEPQAYLQLARAAAAMHHDDLAMLYYEIAQGGNWQGRFGEVKKIAALEYLRFLKEAEAGKHKLTAADLVSARRKSLAEQHGDAPMDLMVSITWNTDGSDVDLHVIEPTGEECFYSHNRTEMGGAITQDVTQGYGPEMYTLSHARPGKFQVRVKYFASEANRASARTKVYVTIYRDWGKPTERVEDRVVTLTAGQEMHEVATVMIEK
ncbi:MAG TPA: DUF2135 domain-containing protein [Pirellulales bacterium]